jgi:hypothetical protein
MQFLDFYERKWGKMDHKFFENFSFPEEVFFPETNFLAIAAATRDYKEMEKFSLKKVGGGKGKWSL